MKQAIGVWVRYDDGSVDYTPGRDAQEKLDSFTVKIVRRILKWLEN